MTHRYFVRVWTLHSHRDIPIPDGETAGEDTITYAARLRRSGLAAGAFDRGCSAPHDLQKIGTQIDRSHIMTEINRLSTLPTHFPTNGHTP